MKPVIEEVITKDGDVITRFSATGRMWIFARFKALEPGLTDEEIAKKCDFSHSIIYTWKKKYGPHFASWLEEAVDMFSNEHGAAMLEAVGMAQALQPNNFQYWREMARTKGVIKDEVKTQNITINTDFSAIIAGGDFDDARRRLLSEIRGVGYTREPRVVDVTPPGQREGSGDRAGQVQGEPVALADPLGDDGGRAERRASLPAVPEQGPSPGVDPVLVKRAVPTGAEK